MGSTPIGPTIKEIMKKALQLLTLTTIAFPPGNRQHHALYMENDELKLCIFMGDTWQVINIDNLDLEKEPQDLVEEIKEILK